jgi:hypothetical protein
MRDVEGNLHREHQSWSPRTEYSRIQIRFDGRKVFEIC